MLALPLLALATPVQAQQPPRVPRIAFVHPGSPIADPDPRLQAFRQGLREHGYTEGQNIAVEVRWADGNLERLREIAAELVRAKVDLIAVASTLAAKTVQEATRTLPIVMMVSGEPIETGVAASLAHPGGNATGFSMQAPELSAKRLQLLKEAFPRVSRAVAVLWNPAYIGMSTRFRQVQSSAPTVGVSVRSVEVRDNHELEAAFTAMGQERPDALLLLVDPFTVSQRRRIVAFAAEKRLPTIYESRDFVDAGGLMSYGPNLLDFFRRSAGYVEKILNGAKPADLPIEQPTRFELIVNLKTAKALGFTIPRSILIRADQVIQ